MAYPWSSLRPQAWIYIDKTCWLMVGWTLWAVVRNAKLILFNLPTKASFHRYRRARIYLVMSMGSSFFRAKNSALGIQDRTKLSSTEEARMFSPGRYKSRMNCMKEMEIPKLSFLSGLVTYYLGRIMHQISPQQRLVK